MKIHLNIFFISTLVFCCLICTNCGLIAHKESSKNEALASANTVSVDTILPKNRSIDSTKIAFGFDFPVGKPDADGYYNAQGFTINRHLGDDWNGVNGGNSDLHDPIYSIGNGYVSYADDYGGGWGNTVRIIHELPSG